MKRSLSLMLGAAALLLIGGSVVWLKAGQRGRRAAMPPVALQTTGTPTIGPVSATPNLMTVNTSTPVIVTVQLSDTRIIPDSVNLLRVNASGNPSVLGLMKDDGTNGDAVAGDKVFTLRVNFNESTAGQVQLQASAAFRGLLRRVASNPIQVDVWNSFSDLTTRISLAFPPLPGVSAGISSLERGTITVAAQNRNGEMFDVLGVTLVENASRAALTDWFTVQVDPEGVLRDNGTFELVTLPTGCSGLFLVGSVPIEYGQRHGSVAHAFIRSKDGARIAVVMGSQENPLYSLGYSPDQVGDLVLRVAATVDF